MMNFLLLQIFYVQLYYLHMYFLIKCSNISCRYICLYQIHLLPCVFSSKRMQFYFLSTQSFNFSKDLSGMCIHNFCLFFLVFICDYSHNKKKSLCNLQNFIWKVTKPLLVEFFLFFYRRGQTYLVQTMMLSANCTLKVVWE